MRLLKKKLPTSAIEARQQQNENTNRTPSPSNKSNNFTYSIYAHNCWSNTLYLHLKQVVRFAICGNQREYKIFRYLSECAAIKFIQCECCNNLGVLSLCVSVWCVVYPMTMQMTASKIHLLNAIVIITLICGSFSQKINK